MLYLDYSREDGEWTPERPRRTREPRGDRVPAGGQRDRLQALPRHRDDRRGVDRAGRASPRPTTAGGLGFGFKWNMGWMHDSLQYITQRPDVPAVPPQRDHVLARLRVQRELRAADQPRRGRARQGLAGRQDARATTGRSSPTCARYLAFMWAHPGQAAAVHGLGVRRSTPSGARSAASTGGCSTSRPRAGCAQLRRRPQPRLPRRRRRCGRATTTPRGFEWIDANDAAGNVFSFAALGRRRRGAWPAWSTSPPCRTRTTGSGCPRAGAWREILNTDAQAYGGSGVGNLGAVDGDGRALARPAGLGDRCASRRSARSGSARLRT